MLLATVGTAAGQQEIAIGVISPEHGGSGAMGVAHRASIEWAFADIGHSVLDGTRHVTLVPVYEDDGGDPEQSVQVATKLVREKNVVAILGPANSGCTAAVLAAGLEVPVISSLSTAPSLTAPTRDPWFFRATIDDRDRMLRFAHFLRESQQLGNPSLALYEANPYGEGLAASLTEALGTDAVRAVRWNDVEADPDSIVPLLPDGQVSLFLLGSESVAVDLAKRLEALLASQRPEGDVRFFFVGAGERLQQDAPDQSISIGEPRPESDAIALLDAPEMVRPFIGSSPKFLLTAYEAGRYVLPQALEHALANTTDRKDIVSLRRELKQALDEKRFDSLVPYRKIKFEGGRLVDPPPTPIFQVARTLKRVDQPPPPVWLRIAAPDHIEFLEEPVSIGIERSAPQPGGTVEIEVLGDADTLIESGTTILDGSRGTYTFHPRLPGRYRIWAKGATNEPVVDVQYPFNYGIAALGALLGAMLVAGRLTISLGHAVQAIIAGALLFALSSYGRAIPELSALPLPSLSASRPVNALLAGVIGGWGGFGALLAFLSRLPWFPKPTQPTASHPGSSRGSAPEAPAAH